MTQQRHTPTQRDTAGAPTVTVIPAADDPTGLTAVATVDNHSNGAVILTWGQTPALPTATNPGDGTTPTRQRYTAEGTWTITATPLDDTIPPGSATITIPLQPAPEVTVQRDPEVTSGLGVIVTVDNHDHGDVTINWGQTPALTDGSNPGDGTTPTRQTYTTAGTWTITARDAGKPDALGGTATVTLPYPALDAAPIVSIVHSDRRGAMTVAANVDNHGRGPVTIDWGQNPPLPNSSHPGDGTTVVRQTYTRQGIWTVTATDADPNAAPGTALMEVATPPSAIPELFVTYDPADPTGMTVQLTVDNAGRGPVNVTWGQWPSKLPTAANLGDSKTPTRQKYTMPGTWTITAEDPTAPGNTASITVPLPNPLAPPVVTVKRDYSVKWNLGVIVTVDNLGRGPVSLDWGQTPDSLPPSTNPGDGTTPSKQAYTISGNWPLVVRSKNDALVRRHVNVAVPSYYGQAAPMIYAHPVDGDPLSVDFVVDNYYYGPVDINPSDNNDVAHVSNPGDGVTSSRVTYPGNGTWNASAVTALFPTSRQKATVPITLPWPTFKPTMSVGAEPVACMDSVYWVNVTVSSGGSGTVDIDWGDKDYPVNPASNPGDGRTGTQRDYRVPGTKIITARSRANPDNTASTTLTTPDHFPDTSFSCTVEQDKSEMTGFGVVVTVDCTDGPVTIDWGQNPVLPTSTNPGDGRTVTSQTYTEPGNWKITITSKKNPTAFWSTYYSVPQASPQAPPVPRCWDAGHDDSHLTVNCYVDNHGHGPVTIDWGDGSSPGTNRGDWVDYTPHKYAKAGTYTVTAQDKQNSYAPPGTWQFTLPFPPAPDIVVTEDGSGDGYRITTRVSVVDPTSGHQQYIIAWNHEQSNPMWLFMPDSATMTEPDIGSKHTAAVQRNVQGALATYKDYTIPYTGPELKLTWTDVSDGKSTATCVVVGAKDGHAYEVQWGQNAAFVDIAGSPPTGTHDFTAPGVWIVTVRDKADHTDVSSAHIPLR